LRNVPAGLRRGARESRIREDATSTLRVLYAGELVRLAAERGVDAGFPDTVQAPIAAPLGTLLPERKAVLQTPWSWAGSVGGGLAAIGGRGGGEVERALHDLSRKELVRPACTSSMESEAEYPLCSCVPSARRSPTVYRPATPGSFRVTFMGASSMSSILACLTADPTVPDRG
jgi:hypothetical protein